MTTTTRRVNEVLDALAGRLAARAGMNGVALFKFVQPASLMEEIGSSVTLAVRITGRQEFPYASKTIKRDEFTIQGEIIALAPGAGDDAAEAAMEQAETWLAEIEDELRADPTLGLGSRVTAQLTDYEDLFTGNTRGRIHGLRYSIDVRVEMVST